MTRGGYRAGPVTAPWLPAPPPSVTVTCGPLTVNGQPVVTWTGNLNALCPDLLRYEQIGQADGLRGRVVRLFFWLLRAWPTRC